MNEIKEKAYQSDYLMFYFVFFSWSLWLYRSVSRYASKSPIPHAPPKNYSDAELKLPNLNSHPFTCHFRCSTPYC